MNMRHVILEMYCQYNSNNNQERPAYCKSIGHICIQYRCEYLGCTYCPNEIAYAGATGVVESINDCIGFGGEMEPEKFDSREVDKLKQKWKSICKNKIDEAYNEYMEFKNNKISD